MLHLRKIESWAETSGQIWVNYFIFSSETAILNFCGSSQDDSAVTSTSDSIEIMFDSRKQNSTEKTHKDCRCGIFSADGSPVNVSLTLIDVRLHSYETKGNDSQQYECSSASISSYVYTESCMNSTSHHVDNFVYNGSFVWEVINESNIFLYNLFNKSGLDSPAMVWLSVSGIRFIFLCLSTFIFFV